MVDLVLALSDPISATVETLASNFENYAMIKDFTTVFDDNEMT